MNTLSRRQFLFFSASLSMVLPLKGYALTIDDNAHSILHYPNTASILKQAYQAEMTAHKHYIEYVKIALSEKYPNIAYTFHAFAISEKIHADNYNCILNKLGTKILATPITIIVEDTKKNLSTSAKNELEKIRKTYPDFLQRAAHEDCDEAITSLMYAWKSHRQHEKKVKQIYQYSGFFFGSVAREIEGMTLDIHVCEICGSTIDEKPDAPCDICNKSVSHYKNIHRP